MSRATEPLYFLDFIVGGKYQSTNPLRGNRLLIVASRRLVLIGVRKVPFYLSTRFSVTVAPMERTTRREVFGIRTTKVVGGDSEGWGFASRSEKLTWKSGVDGPAQKST